MTFVHNASVLKTKTDNKNLVIDTGPKTPN